jgi:hypothetical protein
MTYAKHFILSARIWRFTVIAMALLVSYRASAATLWTGPNITFQQFNPDPTDVIVPGAVELSRGVNGPLYNTAAGEMSANGFSSPVDTLWAFGSINNYSNLNYVTLASIRNGAHADFADVILNQPMVVHLLNEDIYVSIMFTDWPQHMMGGFTYVRSTAPAVPPTVSITNPASSAVFAAPANVTIGASASVSGGTVTNVTFLAGSTALGSAPTAPFSIIASNLSAGPYSLTAVATAGGISATSAVVNITVLMPIAVRLSSSVITNGVFAFDYSANPGLSYVVQSSSNLTSWVSLATNVASSNPVHFTNAFVPGAPHYYRVGRMPNP